MDVVVLAAGKGERLNGYAAPYMKPTLIINGKPLITQVVDLGLLIGGVTVVVAPENALVISQLLDRRDVTMIVQREALGPAPALLEGLKTVMTNDVMVLMGDNILNRADVLACGQHRPSIGVRHLPKEDALRFTLKNRDGRWVERCPRSMLDELDDIVTVWCGPLVADVRRLQMYLRRSAADIGPMLSGVLGAAYEHETTTLDIGVPEALHSE